MLRNIDLHIKSGETVGIIGATGAGKTTITNLVNRFYDISDGQIIEEGSHARLMAAKGRYYSLYTGAFELE